MGVPRYTDEQREAAFLAKCRVMPNGCVEWTGATTYGYGRFGTGGRTTMLAHRWAYRRWVGPLIAGMEIDHQCRNRLCVRPLHLEQVTAEVNQARAEPYERTISTRCAHGHERTPENLRIDPGGRRHCRPCDRARTARIGHQRLVKRLVISGALVIGGP